MNRLYFDNAATSWPKAPGLSRAVMDYLDRDCSNPSRSFGRGGDQSGENTYELRCRIAGLFHAPSDAVTVFTPSLTQALNILIAGRYGRDDHLLVTAFEHNAVMRTLELHHIPYSVLETDGRGNTDYSSVDRLVRRNTRALVVNAASNVSGIVTGLAAAGESAQRHGLDFILDSAQALPFVSIDFTALGISAAAFTAHKGLLGPEGLGGFVTTADFARQTRPLIAGGTGSLSDSLLMPPDAPDRFEAGTQNSPAIAGMLAVLDWWQEHGKEALGAEYRNMMLLHDSLAAIEGIRIVGDWEPERHCCLFSVTTDRMDLAQLSYELERRTGLEARVGLHCAPMAHKALGTWPEGTLRLSPGVFTRQEEIETLCGALEEVLDETL